METSEQQPHVKLTRLGIISFVLGLLSPFALFTVEIAAERGYAGDSLGLFAAYAFLCTAVPAVILGIIAWARIAGSGGRFAGLGFAVGGLATPIGTLLLYLALYVGSHSISYRMVCATNLSGICRAMEIYANDYDDLLPRAGGPDSSWTGRVADWKAPDRFRAYGLKPDGSGGQASITSSLYLLVRYVEVPPKAFICKCDSGASEFKSSYEAPGAEAAELWDFGPSPAEHVSYSYHMPYSPYALTPSSDPGMAVAADRNPWQRSPAAKARDFRAFDPNGTRAQVKAGNAMAHKSEGQNVLFLDGSFAFEKTPACGVGGDNIYTSWSGTDIRRGTPPKLGDQPKDRLDSFLVNDPPKSDDK
ncbi:MAG: DUF4190 domain-containing protein [Phycisphaerales bacterium]|nr:MAG: DUF4190 domain-containing protein [Phycisphaerales bacterium]